MVFGISFGSGCERNGFTTLHSRSQGLFLLFITCNEINALIIFVRLNVTQCTFTHNSGAKYFIFQRVQSFQSVNSHVPPLTPVVSHSRALTSSYWEANELTFPLYSSLLFPALSTHWLFNMIRHGQSWTCFSEPRGNGHHNLKGVSPFQKELSKWKIHKRAFHKSVSECVYSPLY